MPAAAASSLQGLAQPQMIHWTVVHVHLRHLQCGNGWQREYAAMHAAMLRGELPPRYMVVQGTNGLADSLVGAISMLYVAVLQVSNTQSICQPIEASYQS
jgi:hypothetical protein